MKPTGIEFALIQRCQTRHSFKWCTFGGLLLATFVLLGCDASRFEPSTSSSGDTESDSLRSVVERGPLRVITEVTPAEPQLSDEPRFTITYEFEPGVVVNKPPFGESLGDFDILGFREPPATTHDNRDVEQQVYRLEPTKAGELKIAPIRITFRDGRKDVGDQQNHELTTDEIDVTVTTILGDAAPTLSDLRPPQPPVAVPGTFSSQSLLWWLIPLVLLGFIIWWWKRRPTAEATGPMYSPREIAEAALQDLDRSQLAQTDVKKFYVELTGIVRRYLEQTSGVRAPEQTTEEFLRDVADNRAFEGEHGNRLQQFLVSADLVKFAGHQPSTDDVQDALRRARRFIALEWQPMSLGSSLTAADSSLSGAAVKSPNLNASPQKNGPTGGEGVPK